MFLIPLFLATWFTLLRFAHKKDVTFAIKGPLSYASAMFRLAIIFALIEWYAIEFNIPFILFLGMLTFICLTAMAGATGIGVELLGGAVVGFLFIVYQWVFWFPVVEELTSKSAIDGAPARPPAALIGKRGVASTPLRPFGRVVVEGDAYEAKSELNFMDSDAKVEIIAVENSCLLVRES